MVSDYEGHKDAEPIKRKVIYAKFPVTARRAWEALCEVVKTITTSHRGSGGAMEELRWTASIRHDNSLTSKEPKCAK